jgi:tartrate-resistant acid phosphatase type 5
MLRSRRLGSVRIAFHADRILIESCSSEVVPLDHTPLMQRRVGDAADDGGSLRTALLVLGDWGRRGAPGQRRVAAGMARVADGRARANDERGVRLRGVIALGDNFYEDGLRGVDDDHWWSSWQNVYAQHPALRNLPWFPVLGNHDHRGDIVAQALSKSRHDARWRMDGRWYRRSFGDGSIDVFFLDTTPFVVEHGPLGRDPVPGFDRDDARVQLVWLESELRASRAPFRVVVGHHPIRSGSPFHGGAGELQLALEPLLLRHGVAAYFAGHEHDQQVLVTRRGSTALHHVLSGAGAERRRTGVLEETVVAFDTLGFASMTVGPQRLVIRLHAGGSGACLHEIELLPGGKGGAVRRVVGR